MHTYSPSKSRDIIESNVLERNTMRDFLLLFPLLLFHSLGRRQKGLFHILGRRQKGDAPRCRCRRLVATTSAATFPQTHGTHAMGNKGCGVGTPGGTTCPSQHRSCRRYGNDGRQPMLDHGESCLEIFSFCSWCCCNLCFELLKSC
jgi:hypothetical protein